MRAEPLLNERFELRDVIGEGGFSTTYLAYDHNERRQCVVKALSLRRVDTVKAQELFEREAQTLKQLSHASIPRFIDYFSVETDNDIKLYLVQEYIEGTNLADYLERGTRLTPAEVIEIALGVCEILIYLHGLAPPIIHRDIKPSNILITEEKRIYLIDFGAVRDKMIQDPEIKLGGPTIIGTFGYMPMEQFEGRAVPATDLYSLGATLVHLLSRIEPWQMEKSDMKLDFHKHVQVSREFLRILDKMLEPNLRRRYQAASELKADLLALQRGRVSPLPRQARMLAAGMVGVMIFSALLFALMKKNRSKPYRETAYKQLGRHKQDALGDSLPPGALMRLGTERLRHGAQVTALSFSPDGQVIASGSEDRSITLSDVKSGKELRRLENWATVTDLAFTASGNWLLASNDKSTICIWRAATGEPIKRLQGPDEPARYRTVHRLAVSADGEIVALLMERSIHLWREVARQPVMIKVPHGFQQAALALAPDGTRLYAAGRAQTETLLQVWDTRTGELIDKQNLREAAPAGSLLFSQDARQLAVSAQGIALFDVASGRRLSSLPSPEDVMSFSSDGKRLATVASHSKVVIWNLASGERETTISDHRSRINAIALSSDGALIATGATDNAVHLWHSAGGKEALALPGHAAAVKSLAFSRDGQTLITGGDYTARRWQLRDGSELPARQFNNDIRWTEFLDNGRAVAASGSRFHVWDLSSGWEISEVAFESDFSPYHFAVTPDKTRFACANGQWIQIWDIGQGRLLQRIKLKDVQALAYQDNLLAAADSKTIFLWDTATGRELSRAPRAFVYQLAFAGALLVSSGDNLAIWDLTEDRQLKMKTGLGSASRVAITPDGAQVATVDYNNLIRLYRINYHPKYELKLLTTFAGHRGRISEISFMPDKRALVTASSDSTLLVWSLEERDWPARTPVPPPTKPPGTDRLPYLQLGFDNSISGAGIIDTALADNETIGFAPGMAGSALRLSGPIEFPETRALRPGATFTLQFWFHCNQVAHEKKYLTLLRSDLVSFELRDGGRPFVAVYLLNQGGSAAFSLAERVGQLLPGRWYHFAITHDIDNRTATFYMNGQALLKRPIDNAMNISDAVGALQLGDYFKGTGGEILIDELAFYDYARTPEQIAEAAANAAPIGVAQLPRDITDLIEIEKRSDFTVYKR